MNSAEHKAAAERLLSMVQENLLDASKVDDETLEGARTWAHLSIGVAQVHATLALGEKSRP